MGSRSKRGSQRRTGEAMIPRALIDVFYAAASAKAPTTQEESATARGVSRRIQQLCRQHYVSAARLRENHGWTTEQSHEPWALMLGSGMVAVIPKSLRYGSQDAIKALAVIPVEKVCPHDEKDRADTTADWHPLGNSGKGKPTAAWPAWGPLLLEASGANWLKDGLKEAVTPKERRGRTIPLIEPSADTNVSLGYAYDLCAWWANPEGRAPTLTHAFDADGLLRPVDDGAEPQSIAEASAEDRAAWEDALAADAEQDAKAESKRDDGGKPLAASEVKRGGEA